MGLISSLLKALFEDEPARSDGTTEETARPLQRILPIICPYEDLEDDIKYNFETNPGETRVINYRKFLMYGHIEYLMAIYTSKSEDGTCSCDYTMLGNAGDKFWVFYNISKFMDVDFIVRQIREKKDGIYQYRLTPEVRQKLPTFCKLLNNANKVDRDLVYGLPFITFLDAEHKYPLLGAWFNESFLNKQGDMDKLHIALWKILIQMIKEMESAGLLNQSVKTMKKNFLRLAFMLYRLN